MPYQYDDGDDPNSFNDPMYDQNNSVFGDLGAPRAHFDDEQEDRNNEPMPMQPRADLASYGQRGMTIDQTNQRLTFTFLFREFFLLRKVFCSFLACVLFSRNLN